MLTKKLTNLALGLQAGVISPLAAMDSIIVMCDQFGTSVVATALSKRKEFSALWELMNEPLL